MLIETVDGALVKFFRYLVRQATGLRFRRMIRLANDAASARDWAAAATRYRLAVMLRPNASSTWIQYGHALKESNSLEDAVRAYRTAVAQDRRDEETYYHLADLLRRLGRESEVESTLRNAIEVSRENGTSSKESPFILLNRLKAEAAIFGHTQDAEYRFEQILRDFPSRDVIVQYGHLLKDWGRPAEAEAKYRQALERSPRDADIYLHLGHSLKLQGRRAEAIRAYRIAFNLSGRTERVHRHAREELDGLAASVERQVEIPAELMKVPLGQSLQALVEDHNWVALADQLLELPAQAENGYVYQFAAQVLMMIGDEAKAFVILEKLADSDYASEMTFVIMAREKEAKGNLSEAIELYCRGLAVGMRFGEAFEALVRLRQHSRIFAIVEPYVFPSAGRKNESEDQVTVQAAGRTQGLPMSPVLARSLYGEISTQANAFEAAGFSAQARLFREDAAHFAI